MRGALGSALGVSLSTEDTARVHTRTAALGSSLVQDVSNEICPLR